MCFRCDIPLAVVGGCGRAAGLGGCGRKAAAGPLRLGGCGRAAAASPLRQDGGAGRLWQVAAAGGLRQGDSGRRWLPCGRGRIGREWVCLTGGVVARAQG
ncbi:hypothetical protein Ade02nite_81630 [Paractinoplanes deccanensis]|uniref:Uncharacterized protein n=1 Tax=Paractinoplanes deccanensis TaxID=113561 RepID=A0ABQ3YHS4_9ACTN|nr:hypothetical protein Ade02nite_81630 [Actinoplanes deccanensis]